MASSKMAAGALLLFAMLHTTEGFTMPGMFASSMPRTLARSSQSPLSLYMDAALIVQNKGGGHGEIGFHLAKQLKAKGLDVTILQDSAAKMEKLPFKDYGMLGVEVIPCDLSSGEEMKAKVAGKSYTHVFDNFSKDKASAALAETAKNLWNVKSYAFVSSAGMYKSTVPQPMKEDGDVKETGQREVEKYLGELGLPWTSFRPQYIYGPKTNKRDYLDWFIDRIVRDRACPLPGNGKQRASVSNVEDVASMICSVVGQESKAAGQIFNCGTDSFVTYEEICNIVAKAAGKTAKISTYNPKDFDLPKGAFPFRNEEFAVTPEKAKTILGWSTTHTLEGDMAWYYDSYVQAGLDKKDIKFEADQKILGA